MKKLFKIIGVIFIFSNIITTVNIAYAVNEAGTWSYTDNSGVIHGFISLSACKAEHDALVSKSPLSTITECVFLPFKNADEPINLTPLENSSGKSGVKWNYADLITNETSSEFNTQESCELFRKKNSLLNSTTSCASVYSLLAPIGDFTEAPRNIGDYFNIIFKIAIGLCGVLAVVMIVISGVQYMGDESIFGKTEAKGNIMKAILGLLIALGSWTLLNTINPDLLGNKGVSISQVSAEIEGDSDMPIVFNKNNLPTGIICSGGKANIPNIAKSFDKKMTYEFGAKGIPGPNNTIKLDCSGFVNYVLKCADVAFTNGGTSSIFSGAEKVTSTSIQGTKVNNKELEIGDLLGWKAGENSEKFGHVMIYIGNGQIQAADSHGNSTVGNALGTFLISKYQNRIKYIKRL